MDANLYCEAVWQLEQMEKTASRLNDAPMTKEAVGGLGAVFAALEKARSSAVATQQLRSQVTGEAGATGGRMVGGLAGGTAGLGGGLFGMSRLPRTLTLPGIGNLIKSRSIPLTGGKFGLLRALLPILGTIGGGLFGRGAGGMIGRRVGERSVPTPDAQLSKPVTAGTAADIFKALLEKKSFDDFEKNAGLLGMAGKLKGLWTGLGGFGKYMAAAGAGAGALGAGQYVGKGAVQNITGSPYTGKESKGWRQAARSTWRMTPEAQIERTGTKWGPYFRDLLRDPGRTMTETMGFGIEGPESVRAPADREYLRTIPGRGKLYLEPPGKETLRPDRQAWTDFWNLMRQEAQKRGLANQLGQTAAARPPGLYSGRLPEVSPYANRYNYNRFLAQENL